MRKNFDIPSLRAKLAGKSGQQYWRSLEEIAETETFQDFLKHEFPQGVDQWLNPVGRRNFLKLMAASLALGGLSACTTNRPEQIIPYVEAPERIVQSVPQFYATAYPFCGTSLGVLAESHMGRPTKIEGNPDHPASLGKTCAFAQASVLDLYDPDRSRAVKHIGLVDSWTNFLNALQIELEKQRLVDGAGLRLLTETVTSPSLISQIEAILEEFPGAKWYQHEPVNRDNARDGAIMAFGEDVHTVYRVDQADVIVSLDADFMTAGALGGVRYAYDFSQRRRVREDQTEMNRLYMVETTPSATGSLADHHLPLSSPEIESFARALAAELGAAVDPPAAAGLANVPEGWISAIAQDLRENQGQSIVIPGVYQSPVVHALAHAINDALGNVGQTLIYTEPLEATARYQLESLQQLVDEMAAGTVEVLVILDSNPVYNAPADLEFAENLAQVPFKVYQGLYENETSVRCNWHIASQHYLESWGDVRAYDGTVSIIQPLVEPLYDDRTTYQLLAALLGQPGLTGFEVVRDYWSQGKSEAEFEAFWRESLFNGFIADTALPPKQVSPTLAGINATSPAEIEAGVLEIAFRPDPHIWDGRFANNGWMQELPKPVTKLTWDNAALISPALAEKEGLANEDVIELEFQGRSVRAPVWVMPGQAENTVTVHLGYGRERVGRVGNDVGFNAYTLRTTETPWFGLGLQIRKVRGRHRLATTQMHYTMEGRHLVRSGTIEEYREDPHFFEHIVEHEIDEELSLLPGYEYESYAWGMAVDLNVCHGCNACVVACQAENNIPIVGKDQVLVGREMHWLRIDSYFDNLDNPRFYHQPVMCQHCEQAPCELVCPVNATVHDHEGLNVMVYNRCIGTRYCSNNCPYKVRRFNFLHYTEDVEEIDSLKAQKNPDVTVRTRGVMEKCTYCLQRISAARIEAKNENRVIQDGEVVTACQAACPTNAIVFGDTNDPDSAVSRLKAQPQNYGILTELGTRPRTSYLGRLRNPNPEMEAQQANVEEGHG